MDMFVVNGGNPLRGTVAVSGAKNAALPIMAASLMADGETTLRNVPRLVDVSTMTRLLRELGADVGDRTATEGELSICVCDEQPCHADYELVRRMRAGVSVLGPLLAARGRACVSLPGGCNIGDRPIDLHLKGLRALGADIRVERGYVIAEAERLRGTHIYLGGPFGSTVTGTCNVLSAAVLAEGATVIEAASCEPEVVDLGECLNKMGARISGLGTPCLRIEGVERLRGVEHAIIPDRIEAATLMIAAIVTGGKIAVESVRVDHLSAVIETLRTIGADIEWTADNDSQESRVSIAGGDPLRNADVVALPYPGIPTDIQAQMMALLSTAEGLSVVTDRVFPDRFMHAAELKRMGASIRREGSSAIIAGVRQLSGACVMASDLRASAALVLAALAAKGNTVIRRIYHLDRGYESLEKKLTSLGADVRRVTDVPQNLPAEFSTDVATLPLPVPPPQRRRAS